MESFAEMRVLIAGMARSGRACARVLLEEGATPVLYDSKPIQSLENGGELEKLIAAGAADRLGVEVQRALSGCDLVVTSPGVPLAAPILREAKVPVWGEIELGYRLCAAPIAAITGTNGKTTTTALLCEMFRRAGFVAETAGNIGLPFAEVARRVCKEDRVALEVSSFQLETIQSFRPRAAAILNLTEDHLNRHGTMEAYAAAKMRIFANQGAGDVLVLNADDPAVKKMGQSAKGEVWFFSRQHMVERGAWVREGEIVLDVGRGPEPVCLASQVRIPGAHNLENALAAALLAKALGAENEAIAAALRDFPGVEHRIELVREWRGVRFFNDSKGTNVDSTIKAVQAMDRPTVLLAGGYDKHTNFEPLIRTFGATIKHLVVMGETQEQIARAAQHCGFEPVTRARSFEEAVRLAAELARPGDSVLLSPACASFDMFKDYEERGRVFKNLVMGLE